MLLCKGPSLGKFASFFQKGTFQYVLFLLCTRVRSVFYLTNFLPFCALQVVGTAVLGVGVWLAVDTGSFITLTKLSSIKEQVNKFVLRIEELKFTSWK